MLKYIVGITCVFVAHVTEAHPLEGSWQFVKGEYYSEGQVFYAEAPDVTSVKVLSGGHFNYITQKNGEFHYAAGGRYEITEDAFIEHVDYGNIPSLLGKELVFDYELKEQLWHHTLYQEGELVEYEVWQRVAQ
ncbi:hypothetical protein ABMY44_06740 [Pseudoalteromonas sp. Cnat2-41]|uniref:hypothetical protein n=1 Tax=unclassified Pseudoalteromonas TaxID=194690 RepID=UPI001EF7F277|nr:MULTISPECIES: hypothetical protein [unclassified Pseudoalteromonas]MCF2861853.1 hypothetical protein [Pseudoalteromonas sp. CNAT2-18]MCG7557108.1 hypothetical protein [Pseudoalteromonas sp. CNAT2-18.1]